MSTAATIESSQNESGDEEILRLLREAVSAFSASAGVERARGLRGTRPGLDETVWHQMAENGWLGILVPEEFGGLGLGFAEMGVVAEELARVLSPEPIVGSSVLSAILLRQVTESETKTRLLEGIAGGEAIVGTAFSQRSFGEAKVSAIASDAGHTLSGTCHNVFPALCATDFIVAADIDGERALFHVAANTTGLIIEETPRTDGTFAGKLMLDGIEVGAPLLKGAAAEAALQHAQDAATVITCSELFGIMQETLERTLDYMRTRVQFDKPIGSFQALQHRAVDLWIEKELSLCALGDALKTLDSGNSTPAQVRVAASRAKARIGTAAHSIGREAISLHGAIGVTDEYDIGLFLRRSVVLNAWLGTPDLHRRRYGMLRNEIELDNTSHLNVEVPEVFLQDERADIDWNQFSDEEFRAGVFAWLDKAYPQEMRHTGRRGSADEMHDWMKVIGKKGWIAPAWPVEWGGMGLSPGKQIIFIEERERVGVMRNPDMGVVMFGPMLMRWGTEAQKQRYLPKIIENEEIWCQGYSEPNAGSDLASLRTSAVLEGDYWVINGSKIWTSSGHWADHMFLLARTDKTVKKQAGISFFILDMNTPGVSVRPIENIAGHEEFAEVFFEDVRIPKDNIVGEVNNGWTVAKSLLGFERLNSGSPRTARAALQAVEKVARANGAWEDPVFQSKYNRIHLDIADLSSAYQRFADIISLGDTPGAELSQLKIVVATVAQQAGELLIETAGEAGSLSGMQEFDGNEIDVTGPFYAHFTSKIASGTNDIQRNIIAKRVLELP